MDITTESPKLRALVLPLGLCVAGGLAACSGDGGGTTTEPEPTTGTVEVTANTTGETPDENGYIASLDGGNGQSLDPDGSVTFTDVAEGSHQLELSDLQVNCDPTGENPVTVDVTAGSTATATFDVLCPKAFLDEIAFETGRDAIENAFQIYHMQTEGSSPTRLTVDGGGEPNISPDGTQIAFVSSRSGDFQIWTINADGTGLEQVTDSGEANFKGAPAWSSDGTRIAFDDDRDGDSEIYTIDPDGTGLEQVTDNSAADPNDVIDADPDWSPDATRIAFHSSRDGDHDIYTIDPDGTGLEQVTDHPAVDVFPAWSPDGSKIAFSSKRDGDRDIYTLNPDGTGLEQVTDHPAVDVFPAWSPDGSKIAFSSKRDGDREIWVVDLDDGSVSQLSDDPSFDNAPDWGPEG